MIQVKRLHATQLNHRDYISILDFLRSTLLGKFYLRYLRQYPPIRSSAIWIWKNFLSLITLIYCKFKYSKFIQLSDTVGSSALIYPKQKVLVSELNVYPREKSENIQTSPSYEFPEMFITTITDCVMTGSSNFIHTKQAIIGHNAFRISHDYTSEELHGRLYINAKKKLITRLTSIKTDIAIDQGVPFNDAVSTNYAHFMTEILPRVYAYIQNNPDKTVPLIIDSDLHTNLMQALEIVVGADFQLIGLEKGEPLKIKSLKVISACGYVPFERRPHTKRFFDHSQGIFSPTALLGMRDLIENKISELQPNVAPNKIYKKIWIKRNSTYRNVSNSVEIENVLVAQGFTVIEPEKLSFVEQVSIFGNADIIVGATGAALANLIFCKPETKIIILIAEYKHMIYGYWQNMAASVGNQVTYVLGVNADKVSEIHSNFKVELTDLLEVISD